MDITMHASVLPHDDPDASVAFYRDALGFEVASSVLATVRPLSSPEVKRLGLVRRTEVLRNG